MAGGAATMSDIFERADQDYPREPTEFDRWWHRSQILSAKAEWQNRDERGRFTRGYQEPER
jgi:hypothetical protein